MRITYLRRLMVLFVALALPAFHANATSILQQNLSQMSKQARQIVRGRVMNIEEVSVEVGGGTLKALRYRVLVTEVLKGQVDSEKGVKYTEFTMIGSMEAYKQNKVVFASLPNLRMGREYLLMMGRVSSSTGLTNTVGLANGCFEIDLSTKEELSVNGFNNSRLFQNMGNNLPNAGPIPYADLASLIRRSR